MDTPNPFEGLSKVQKARKLLDDALESLSSVHQQMREERAFVWKLEQYSNDSGNVRDRTRVQPRSQSIFRLARYKAGQMLKQPPYFKARPVDMQDDPKAAARAKWALEHDLGDPRKRYDIIRRNLVWSGLTSRIGCYHLAWNPDSGPYGDVELNNVDGTHIAWDPSCTDPHDPRCAWFAHWEDMPIDAIARMRGWKNNKDIKPDSGTDSGRPATVDRSGAVTFEDSRGERQPMSTQQTATVLLLWERFGKYEKPESKRVLAPEDRYMVATDGPMSGQRMDYQAPDGVLPEIDVLEDGTPLQRIDAEATDEGRLGYPNGTLTICAPYSGGEGVELWSGPWPQKMRFYPYVVWQPYGSPFEQISTSDVVLNWTMTLVQNGTLRTWYEQLRASRGVMMLPERGLTDYMGEPFTYSDANGVQAFYTGAAPPQISYVRGPEASPQIPGFLQYVGAELRSQEGTGDLQVGGSADSLKGIAVGTIQQAAETGNVAIDDHIASLAIEEAVGLNVWHDIQRARWTVERWVRYLGQDGMDAFLRMKGSDLPAADIMITTRPMLDQLNAESIQGAVQLAQLAQQSPALAGIVARRANMDPEDVAAILGEAQQMQQQAMMNQQQEAMAKMIPGVPGGSPGAMPPGPAAIPQQVM